MRIFYLTLLLALTSFHLIGQPGPITGPASVCSGAAVTLSDTTAGGTWSSGAPAIASVGSGSGVVVGLSAGIANITYTTGSGFAVSSVTVNAVPGSISGPSTMCNAATAAYSSGTPGGTWSSSNTSIATVSSGTVTAVSVGSVILSYTVPTGCFTTMSVTINPSPFAFSLTGGGGYCAGGAGVTVGLTGSAPGTNYQLYNGGSTVGSAIAGTGSAISFGLVPAGTYTATATNPATSCSSPMAGSASVFANPLPFAYSVTGGGPYCAGGSGVHIGLTASQAGINYALFSGSTFVTVMSGTGTLLDFGLRTTAGTYTVNATNAATGCTNNMTGSATISLSPIPNAYSVSGGGSYCAGGTGVPVNLAASDLGVTYQLYAGTTPVGAHAGSGTTLSFGNQTASGTYTVVGTNTITGCTNTMTGSVVVSVNPAPAAVTGSSVVCTGSATTLSDTTSGGTWTTSNPAVATIDFTTGSLTGVTPGATSIHYTLPATGCSTSITISVSPSPAAITGPSSVCTGFSVSLTDATPGGSWLSSSPVIAAVGSTGSATGISAGAANITYASGACYAVKTITVNAVSPIHNVVGGGGYCPGTSGSDVALDGSNPGFYYQLYNGSTAVGSPLSGLGGPLDFGFQTAAGAYTVKATSAGGCTNTMNGTASVSILPTPASFTVTGGGGYCPGGVGVHIGLSGSQIGVVYQLMLAGAPAGPADTGTGAILDFGLHTSGGAYTVIGTLGSCSVSMAGSAPVSTYLLPTVFAVAGGGSYCFGGSGVPITLGGSQPGVIYKLYNGSTLAATDTGSGSAFSFGIFAPAGTYTVMATNPGTGCSANMAGAALVNVHALPPTFPVTGGGSYCAGGSGVHIALSGSTSGINYQLSFGGGPVGSIIAGTGSSIDFGPQTVAGTYNVIATNASTLCSTGMTGSAMVSITPTVTPTVAITSSAGDTVCAGTPEVYTAHWTNGGTTPLFSWDVNGVLTGTIGSSYSYVPSHGDVITVHMTSSALCATPTVSAASAVMTVHAYPVISGPSSVCMGSTATLTSSVGSTWTSSVPSVAAIATVGVYTGVLEPFSVGSTVISCSMFGCTSTRTVTVNPLPVISITSVKSCGGATTLTASGATAYAWSPALGLSCSTCAIITTSPSLSSTYTVTGTASTGCRDTATVSVDANRISGYLSYGVSSYDTFRVWLIRFNTTDTSVISIDSVLTCMDAGAPYYEFDDPVPGNYMVKAQLLGPSALATGFIPTYGYQASYWSTASSVLHGNAKDTLHVNMIPVSVLSGPGFIGGSIATGTGVGSGGYAPAPGVLVYLKDQFGVVLSYTYTDALGNYSFPNIANGIYTVYPEDFDYHTTESATVSLSSSNDSAKHIDFHIMTAYKVVVPVIPTRVSSPVNAADILVYPNPAHDVLNVRWSGLPPGDATVTMTDMVGRTAFISTLNFKASTGETQLAPDINPGMYLLSIRSGDLNYCTRIVISK